MKSSVKYVLVGCLVAAAVATAVASEKKTTSHGTAAPASLHSTQIAATASHTAPAASGRGSGVGHNARPAQPVNRRFVLAPLAGQ